MKTSEQYAAHIAHRIIQQKQAHRCSPAKVARQYMYRQIKLGAPITLPSGFGRRLDISATI